MWCAYAFALFDHLSVEPVRGGAVSPDKSAVVASRGNQIHVYDAGSGAFVRRRSDGEQLPRC